MLRRTCQRIPLHLEAKLVSDKASYIGFIENISESGLYAKITCMDNSAPDSNPHIKFRVPHGQPLDLECKRVWSRKDMSDNLTEHIGMEIVNPPQEYNHFYQNVKLGKLNFFDLNKQFTSHL
jgi:hypothetical protein